MRLKNKKNIIPRENLTLKILDPLFYKNIVTL